jgi:hypothetical protein
MNEKIRELAEQANIHFSRVGILDGDPNGMAKLVSYSKMEKFAELIVQECADLYNHEDVLAPIGMSARGEAHQHGWIEGTKTYRDTILEHFGVEQ